MEFHVRLAGPGDLTGQIYRQIRTAVLDGRLRPGDALPPTRELAQRLAVSRNTVSLAYDRLADEGFLISRVGSGTYVSDSQGLPTADRERTSGALTPVAKWADIAGPPRPLAAEPEYDFRAGVPDARLFPFETWRRLVTRTLRPAAVRTAMYDEPSGLAGLRAAIARHVGVARAVPADPSDIVVTSGTQQALDLIARVLLEPGDGVAVEDPGFPPHRLLFESLGMRVTPVPVDDAGLVVSAIPPGTRLVCVSPSHQFPLGMPMSLPRRMELLAWAERANAAVVEDDYDSEFRFGGRPLEPLRCLDNSGRVIYVGTFSKTMLPTLRLGFLVAPSSLHSAFRSAKYVSDWHCPVPTQAALADFIDEGMFARHVRKMRNEYRARYERVLTGLHPWLTPLPSLAGMHMSAVFAEPGHDDAMIARRAKAEGVAIHPLSGFYAATPTKTGLVLGYGAVALPKITEGLRRLRAVSGA